MIAQAPIVLALLGTALMAIVIFAPQVRPASAVVSFAPPHRVVVPAFEPSWPLLVDPRAGPCDPLQRLALVDALAAVGSPWAGAILAQAAEDESDPQVRDAIARARTAG